MTELHTYNDGSKLIRSTVYELMKIPNYRNQRYLDTTHAKKLGDDVEDVRFLDNGYRVIVMPDEDADGNAINQRYIVDGQHRMKVLIEARDKGHFEDFQVTYMEKRVKDDTEAIAYFDIINNAKPVAPQGPAEDSAVMVGRFTATLQREFTLGKKLCIKQGRTARPYLNIEDVREVLKKDHVDSLRRTKPTDFAARVWEWNRKEVDKFEKMNPFERDIKVNKCIEINFALALDPKLPWIAECLP